MSAELAIRTSVRPHEHAVFVYDDEGDMLYPFDHFLREGVARKELTTFVHTYAGPRDAGQFLARKISDVGERERNKDLVLAHHRDAFERNGRIDHDHAGNVVGMLKASAHDCERHGVRIFVDASKRYLSAGRQEEWFAFERFLGPHLAGEFGLVCAYRAEHLRDPATLAMVLQTHAYRFNAPGAPVV